MQAIDMTGQTIGLLTVEGRTQPTLKWHKKSAVWKCLCRCGNRVDVLGRHLRIGHVKSCGCFIASVLLHGRTKLVSKNTKHNLWADNEIEYQTWYDAKRRCYDSEGKSFKNYGGRGISMCEEWRNDFPAFLKYMGKKPRGMTLDRINNDGHYEPGNCRWATISEQNQNRRSWARRRR